MKPRSVYVNGRFLPYAQAAVHVEDRGFQFADSVYEVWAVLGGVVLDREAHAARLERNLAELRITPPMGWAALSTVLGEAARRNRVREGLVYVQVTRGTAGRDPLFPSAETPATVVVIARPVDRGAAQARAAAGIAVVTRPDERWARCDLKTVGLLPNVLGKEAARAEGAGEVWFVDRDGRVTEGASSTAWMVDGAGRLWTRPLGPEVLPGVTRGTVLELARDAGFEVVEAAFTPAQAGTARELFTTSASGFVTPVVRLDGAAVGEGRPGPAARRLRSLYLEKVRNAAR